MVDWFWRKRRRTPAFRLRSRDDAAPTTRIDLKEFTPAPVEYLARAAYLELSLFEDCSRAVAIAPSTVAKQALAAAAGEAIDRHRALVALLAAQDVEPTVEIDRYRSAVDRFQRLTPGQDWAEAALTCFLAGGFLDDLLLALADGLPRDLAGEVREIFATSPDDTFVDLFTGAIADNPRLSARLALWGRRILGDALLVARDVLSIDAAHAPSSRDEERIEPAFSELVAQHTRRMDALGLSA